MPAEIESMMYVGEQPWHGLGKELPAEVPAGDAIREAGLDWKVSKQPVSAAMVVDDGNGSNVTIHKDIPGFRAIVRDSDKRILSVQSKDYQVFQNDEMFAFGDALVGSKRARYHTAGSLQGGRRVWALMKTDKLLEVTSRDRVEAYLLLANSHDGTLAFRAAFTGVRVVCQNTLNAALAGVRQCVSVRHTGKLSDRIAQAQEVLGLADGYFQKFQDVAQALVKTRYTDKQMADLAESIFPSLEVQADGTVTVKDAAKANGDKVRELFTTGLGHKDIEGTAWAAYNAIAEFTDHHAKTRTTERSSAQENRLNSIWFGNASILKQKALATISKQTGVGVAA